MDEQLDTGDIVLFERNCGNMNAFGATICFATKFIGNTKWDHVGVIIRDPKSSKLFVLEASLSGVKMRNLEDRIRMSNSRSIAVKHLSCNKKRDAEFQDAAYRFAQKMIGRPYENRLFQLFNAAFSVPPRLRREELSLELSKNSKLVDSSYRAWLAVANLPDQFVDAPLKALKRKMLDDEYRKRENIRFKLRNSHRSLFENYGDDSKLFCSELIASLYQELGILDTYPPPNAYAPWHLTIAKVNFIEREVVLHEPQTIRNNLDNYTQPICIVEGESSIKRENTNRHERVLLENLRPTSNAMEECFTDCRGAIQPKICPNVFERLPACDITMPQKVSSLYINGFIAHLLTAPAESRKILAQIRFPRTKLARGGSKMCKQSSLLLPNLFHTLKFCCAFPINMVAWTMVNRCSDSKYIDTESTSSSTLFEQNDAKLFMEARNFILGGTIGLAVQSILFPLECFQTKAIADAQLRPTNSGNINFLSTSKVHRAFQSSSLAAFSTFGLTYSIFEFLRPRTDTNVSQHNSAQEYIRMALCASFSGVVAQFVAFPFEVVSKCVQVENMYITPKTSHPFRATSAIDCARHIWRRQGLRGFYRGFPWGVVKVVPCVTAMLVLPSN